MRHRGTKPSELPCVPTYPNGDDPFSDKLAFASVKYTLCNQPLGKESLNIGKSTCNPQYMLRSSPNHRKNGRE